MTSRSTPTVLVQTTTSLTVALVAAGALTIEGAIPIIMGWSTPARPRSCGASAHT